MKGITASKARENLYKLIDETAMAKEPVQIVGRRSTAVLIGLKEWEAMQETLYLLSIKGMRQSLLKARRERSKATSDKLGW